jgi:hypothetical protein
MIKYTVSFVNPAKPAWSAAECPSRPKAGTLVRRSGEQIDLSYTGTFVGYEKAD